MASWSQKWLWCVSLKCPCSWSRITIYRSIIFFHNEHYVKLWFCVMCWLLSCFSLPGGVGKVRSEQLVPDPCWWTPDQDGSGGQARGGWGTTWTQGMNRTDITCTPLQHTHTDITPKFRPNSGLNPSLVKLPKFCLLCLLNLTVETSLHHVHGCIRYSVIKYRKPECIN